LIYATFLAVTGVFMLRGFRHAVKMRILYQTHPDFGVGGRPFLMFACILITLVIRLGGNGAFGQVTTSFVSSNGFAQMLTVSAISCLALELCVIFITQTPRLRVLRLSQYGFPRDSQRAETLRYYLASNVVAAAAVFLAFEIADHIFNLSATVDALVLIPCLAIVVLLWITLFRVYPVLVRLDPALRRGGRFRRLYAGLLRWSSPVILFLAIAGGIAAQAEVMAMLFPGDSDSPVRIAAMQCRVGEDGHAHVRLDLFNSNDDWLVDASAPVPVMFRGGASDDEVQAEAFPVVGDTLAYDLVAPPKVSTVNFAFTDEDNRRIAALAAGGALSCKVKLGDIDWTKAQAAKDSATSSVLVESPSDHKRPASRAD
ncbi:MAG: hypothetical protein JOZ27_08515, partial [Caulobacteraceae bacterium]|nr:hypothetical protein [Caulobacteraceae bacterium]